MRKYYKTPFAIGGMESFGYAIFQNTHTGERLTTNRFNKTTARAIIQRLNSMDCGGLVEVSEVREILEKY